MARSALAIAQRKATSFIPLSQESANSLQTARRLSRIYTDGIHELHQFHQLANFPILNSPDSPDSPDSTNSTDSTDSTDSYASEQLHPSGKR